MEVDSLEILKSAPRKKVFKNLCLTASANTNYTFLVSYNMLGIGCPDICHNSLQRKENQKLLTDAVRKHLLKFKNLSHVFSVSKFSMYIPLFWPSKF